MRHTMRIRNLFTIAMLASGLLVTTTGCDPEADIDINDPVINARAVNNGDNHGDGVGGDVHASADGNSADVDVQASGNADNGQAQGEDSVRGNENTPCQIDSDCVAPEECVFDPVTEGGECEPTECDLPSPVQLGRAYPDADVNDDGMVDYDEIMAADLDPEGDRRSCGNAGRVELTRCVAMWRASDTGEALGGCACALGLPVEVTLIVNRVRDDGMPYYELEGAEPFYQELAFEQPRRRMCPPPLNEEQLAEPVECIEEIVERRFCADGSYSLGMPANPWIDAAGELIGPAFDAETCYGDRTRNCDEGELSFDRIMCIIADAIPETYVTLTDDDLVDQNTDTLRVREDLNGDGVVAFDEFRTIAWAMGAIDGRDDLGIALSGTVYDFSREVEDQDGVVIGREQAIYSSEATELEFVFGHLPLGVAEVDLFTCNDTRGTVELNDDLQINLSFDNALTASVFEGVDALGGIMRAEASLNEVARGDDGLYTVKFRWSDWGIELDLNGRSASSDFGLPLTLLNPATTWCTMGEGGDPLDAALLQSITVTRHTTPAAGYATMTSEVAEEVVCVDPAPEAEEAPAPAPPADM